ncbi:MAG: hypothetical protein J7L41_02800 [Synergistetes bacterium]|nr:hypothetical protein [Synergistota bacterium]
MRTTLDFKEIADNFSHALKTISISRCDYVSIKEILFVEETNLSIKELTNPYKYSQEVIENVKKMWGSLSILIWYLSSSEQIEKLSRKERVYIIKTEKISNRSFRFISNLIKALNRYKNGVVHSIKYKEVTHLETQGYLW